MLYSKFIYNSKELTIKQLDNGTWYLDPEWKDIICRDITSNIDTLEDSYISDWWDVENILRLETDKRNAENNKKKEVIDWIYNIISTVVEPEMIDEENTLMKNAIEYLKLSREQKD